MYSSKKDKIIHDMYLPTIPNTITTCHTDHTCTDNTDHE